MPVDAKIHVAFRFHTNLYHSYRSDSLDEDGIGKDIRIIRYILDILDAQNAKGVPVRGTWDIENHYSLGVNMPRHCPELLERIKERVRSGVDEVELMSFNNGLVSAHTEEEFVKCIEWSISNPWNSGVKDVFGKFAPIVRPQECMMTPGLIPLYKKLGVEALSIYYSAISFNGFSSFVPLLPVEKRFNPLWWGAPGSDERMLLLPAVNPGDSLDNFGMASFIKRLRREQEKLEKPCDMLVILDMDADDDYWQGIVNVTASGKLGLKKPLLRGGINVVINGLKSLPYVVFDTPYNYLKSHEPAGEVLIGQDIADGSYDGHSPWADKLENSKLWAGIERGRLLSRWALAVSDGNAEIRERVAGEMQSALLPLSTTHFGLSTPVMCRPRLLQAMDMVKNKLDADRWILARATELSGKGGGVRAVLPKEYFRGKGQKRGLLRLRRTEQPLTGEGIELSVNREVFGGAETNLVYSGEGFDIPLQKGGGTEAPVTVFCKPDAIGNSSIELRQTDNALTLFCKGAPVTASSFFTCVTYDKKRRLDYSPTFSTEMVEGKAAVLTESGCFSLTGSGEHVIEYTKKFWVIGDLPYLYADVEVNYPKTGDYKTNSLRVRRLHRGYDLRWNEIMPLEILPVFTGSDDAPIRVHKHNYLGDCSYFDYDFGAATGNLNIDSSNNAVTCGYAAFSAGGRGLLLAQSAFADSSFAFVRSRIRRVSGRDKIYLNPFGVYIGRQLNHPVANHKFTDLIAGTLGESFMSCAPSFRGGHQQFSLMIAPFEGDKPGDDLINDAIFHAYPPYILSDDPGIEGAGFAEWDIIGDLE